VANLDFEEFVSLKFLLSIEGIGTARVQKLLQKFNSFHEILSADARALYSANCISENTASRISAAVSSQKKSYYKKVETELKNLENIGAGYLTFFDEAYPEMLKNIYDPPLIIYIKGKFMPEDRYSVAIVGTRNPTEYGKKQAQRFAGGLAEQRITIVSGLASGIDSVAHKVALERRGRSIAVMGTGLDMTYPAINHSLCSEIAEHGAVITEYEWGIMPEAQNFPRRNRIISGLSLGVLVVQSAVKGGSLITAKDALEQNREIFAVPGNLGDDYSEGTNALIRDNKAKLVTSPEEIISELNLKMQPVEFKKTPNPEIQLNLFEEKIVECLSSEPCHIDKISSLTSLSTSECLVYLLSLEFKGLVRQFPGKMFSID